MDKWIELVKAKMSELKITQEKLAERLAMSQGGIGHWLNKRRQPSLEDMNRVLRELGLGFLEVALVIREPELASDEPQEGDYEVSLAQKYNPYFRYPVSDWQGISEVREAAPAAYAKGRHELSDYHAQGPAFWLVVVGDAMTAPSGISIAQDMLILVDPAAEAVPGKLVIAQWPDSAEATFRKLIEEGGQRYLVPLNPTYPKALFTNECRIIGVVVQATAKF
ncbi:MULTISPECIES: LexA family transcriptional regulator [unclassified Pseudomonas]|uniref:LexA family protein n=1 Tax=unclassified Pseudomonas TaxID=196821 RepID=UPI000CD269F1|nr:MULTISPECIES: S24 family peptidase [unclassified Pseudomonas]POA31621.1 Cro/Cl family transcriptional regulator [Pseudomonas sp. GW456-R21]POA69934.1 Cro/Cl family transcriptional regulator [Pseudomonas sp. GW460-R15]